MTKTGSAIPVSKAYTERVRNFFNENGFAIGTVALTALATFFIGMFVSQTLLPAGDIDHTRRSVFESAIGEVEVGTLFAAIFACMGLLLAVGGWGNKFASQQTEGKAIKVTRVILMLLGLGVAAFGVGYFSGATAMKTHHAFADDDAFHLPNSEAYTPERWAHLQHTLDGLRGTGIALTALGGLIFAGGLATKVPERIYLYGLQLYAYLRAKNAKEILAQSGIKDNDL